MRWAEVSLIYKRGDVRSREWWIGVLMAGNTWLVGVAYLRLVGIIG